MEFISFEQDINALKENYQDDLIIGGTYIQLKFEFQFLFIFSFWGMSLKHHFYPYRRHPLCYLSIRVHLSEENPLIVEVLNENLPLPFVTKLIEKFRREN